MPLEVIRRIEKYMRAVNDGMKPLVKPCFHESIHQF
jgi:hypothetical protein